MESNASLILRFPVKAHVYKYLQYKVGEKLIVTNHHFIGGMVLDMLSKKYCDLKAIENEYLFPVEISLRYFEKNGFYIDAKTLRKFNYRVDSMFREQMRNFVDMNYRLNNIPKESSLKTFLFEYNITEEDVPFETLVKDIQRNTNRKEDKKN